MTSSAAPSCAVEFRDQLSRPRWIDSRSLADIRLPSIMRFTTATIDRLDLLAVDDVTIFVVGLGGGQECHIRRSSRGSRRASRRVRDAPSTPGAGQCLQRALGNFPPPLLRRRLERRSAVQARYSERKLAPAHRRVVTAPRRRHVEQDESSTGTLRQRADRGHGFARQRQQARSRRCVRCSS